MGIKKCRLKQGLFDRWYILHERLDDAAWSGSTWVSVDEDCYPTGGVQVCNFSTEEDARQYCDEFGLTPV